MTESTEGIAKVVLVDDEESILRSLKRELRSICADIHTFSNPLEALAEIDTIQPHVVMSDVRMAEMDGIDLMCQIAEKHPLVERILLTGYADMEATINAINKGRIHYYMEKPWDSARLLRATRKGIEMTRLRKRNEALEQTIREQNTQLKEWNDKLEQQVALRTQQLQDAYSSSISTFSAFVDQRMQGHQSSSRHVADLAMAIATAMGLNNSEKLALKYAALLRNVGKLGFTDELLCTPYYSMNSEQRKQYQQHPDLAAVALGALKPMVQSARILATFCENIDGSGYPDALKEGDIPLTAQILSVASDFYDAMDGYMWPEAATFDEAKSWLEEKQGQLYSESVIEAALPLLSEIIPQEQEGRLREAKVATHSLTPGMQLTRDLISPAGVLLLARGTELEKSLINHLLRLERSGPEPLELFVRDMDG
ncbi:MAG: HD domain-containing phosphohydrolase [Pseudomonadota bacterium]|nr:HD domain-containing phosphohydrolase [Pseudomonadota bacterium]